MNQHGDRRSFVHPYDFSKIFVRRRGIKLADIVYMTGGNGRV